MTRRDARAWGALAARLFAGAVFAVSGFTKLLSPAEDFALSIESYRLVSVTVSMAAARVLPWVELIAGLYLLAGYFVPVAAVVTALSSGTFVVALISAAARQLPQGDCGCFGEAGPHLTRMQALGLDAVLLCASLFVFFDRERLLSLDRFFRREARERA